jgi:hypothetical protein
VPRETRSREGPTKNPDSVARGPPLLPWHLMREPMRDRARFTRTGSSRTSAPLAGIFRIACASFCTCELPVPGKSSQVQKWPAPSDKTPARRGVESSDHVLVNGCPTTGRSRVQKRARVAVNGTIGQPRRHASGAPRRASRPSPSCVVSHAWLTHLFFVIHGASSKPDKTNRAVRRLE